MTVRASGWMTSPRDALRRSVLALAIALGALLVPAAASAPATAARLDLDDFAFESMDVVYTLGRDEEGHATLDVVETLVAVFPDFDQNRGFYRDIPDYYGDEEHGWVNLETEALSVTDARGDPVPFETEYYADFYSIALGDDSYVHGRQSYVIHYTQRNTIRSFPAMGGNPAVDEFYWDVNGTGWSQPFGRVSAELHVDPELVPELFGTAACYAGYYGGEDECESGITRTDDPETGEAIFRASATNLWAEETLTIAVAFEPGTFVDGRPSFPPSYWDDDDDGGWASPPPVPEWMSALLSVLAPLGVVAGFVARLTSGNARWRRHAASDIVIPQYEPPQENIQLAARLIGAPDRAFAAHVVDLAVRGKIRIIDDPTDASDAFVLELRDGDGLDAYDRRLVTALFGSRASAGKRFGLDNQGSAFAKAYDRIRKDVEQTLRNEGYVGRARATGMSRVLGVTGVASALGTWGTYIAAESSFGTTAGPFIGALAATWGGWQTLTHTSTTYDLTAKGKKLNDYLLGMKDYLTLAEEDRFRVLQSVAGAERLRFDPNDRAALVHLYERLLPWAIMWGVEKSWGEVLIAQAAQANVPLTWVSTPHSLTQWRMHEALTSINRAAPAPPAPPPAARSTYTGGGGWSSSGSSSFSSGSFGGGGGGFSGGGGGGGGGRGR